MRWPWQKAERRETGGNYSDAVLRIVEAAAAGNAADTAATAAVEAAAGTLARAFAGAEVRGPAELVDAVTPGVLAQIGRDLVRSGASMHEIRISGGDLVLLPASSWFWQGAADPRTWFCQVSVYGPSTSETSWLPADALVFVRWGGRPGTPYRGVGPLQWASLTAKLLSETERSLGDEAAGPLAQLLAIPQDAGDDGDEDDDTDPLAGLKADLAGARGKAMLVETTAGGWGEGRTQAPMRDWQASRLGPQPPEALAKIRSETFASVLSACGTPPALFTGADGTSQRESFRRYLTSTIQPLGRLVEAELTAKLEGPITLNFDSLYAHDLQGRASSFQRLVAGGATPAEALQISGLMADSE